VNEDSSPLEKFISCIAAATPECCEQVKPVGSCFYDGGFPHSQWPGGLDGFKLFEEQCSQHLKTDKWPNSFDDAYTLSDYNTRNFTLRGDFDIQFENSSYSKLFLCGGLPKQTATG
jgi:hypothetical protein